MNLINVYEKAILDAKHIIENQDKEIERLQNIMDELEKLFIENLKEGRSNDHLWLMGYYDASKDYLNKLKDLKEGNKDE